MTANVVPYPEVESQNPQTLPDPDHPDWHPDLPPVAEDETP